MSLILLKLPLDSHGTLSMQGLLLTVKFQSIYASQKMHLTQIQALTRLIPLIRCRPGSYYCGGLSGTSFSTRVIRPTTPGRLMSSGLPSRMSRLRMAVLNQVKTGSVEESKFLKLMVVGITRLAPKSLDREVCLYRSQIVFR